ncbi:hypothetical protein HEK131_27820 [Streptomyces seoulensis]|nr:hypothetical protein HEK131_27820 [Streptomyces seoulensis]
MGVQLPPVVRVGTPLLYDALFPQQGEQRRVLRQVRQQRHAATGYARFGGADRGPIGMRTSICVSDSPPQADLSRHVRVWHDDGPI